MENKNLPLTQKERNEIISGLKEQIAFLKPGVELMELQVREIAARRTLNKMFAILEKEELQLLHRQVEQVISEKGKDCPALAEILSDITDIFAFKTMEAGEPTDDEKLSILSPSIQSNEPDNTDHQHQETQG